SMAAGQAAGVDGQAAVFPVIGVLALQGDVVEHLQMLSALGARSVTVRRPGELAAVDALVIPGGESTTMWKLAVAFDMAEPLRKRISGGIPAFGPRGGMINLGHPPGGGGEGQEDGVEGQETVGGINMTVRRNAFGRQVDSFESEVPLERIAGPPGPAYCAVFIRAPWVEAVGGQVEVLGTERTTGRIVAVRQGPLLATSFHPELTGDLRIHELFADMVNRRS